MVLETDTLHAISPLDSNEGDRYNDPVNGNAHSSIIVNIYQIKVHREDYINSRRYGEIIWRSVKSFDMDLEDAMERS